MNPLPLLLRAGARLAFGGWLVAAVLVAAPATPGQFFGPTNTWDLRLSIGAEDWHSMEPAEPERGPGPPGPPPAREYPWATARFECAGVVLTNVAVRFKGNSSFMMSRRGLKRPLKLDFNRGHPGRTFAGLAGLMLGNNANDPSQLHEALAYAAFARAGVPAPRTAFVRVHLDIPGIAENRFVGVYTAVEPVDSRFLLSRFGTKDGVLAKPERMPGPRYFGEDWSAYVDRFEVKREGTAREQRRLIDFVRLVDRAPDAEFASRLAEYVDPAELARFTAVNAWLANMDSMLGTGHNHYLHVAPDGRIRFIPWDLNEAFGGHPGAGPALGQAGFDVLHPNAPNVRLLERFLSHPAFAAQYRSELSRLATNALSATALLADLARGAEAIGPSVERESPMARAGFRRVALGDTNGPSQGPRLGGPGGPVGPGFMAPPLADWIRLRAAEVEAQLAGEKTGSRPSVGRGGGPGGPGGPRGPRGPRPPPGPPGIPF